MTVISVVLVTVGLFFMVVSAIGLLVLPGLYTRAHAVAKSETLALLLVLAGMFFHPSIDLSSGTRLAFVLVFSMVANPTAVHVLLRAARRAGVEPWRHADADEARSSQRGE